MNTETQQAILAEVMAEIDASRGWDLAYIDYRDKFDQEQVDALARGDWETLDESVDEWLHENRWMSAHEVLNEIVGELGRDDDGWDEAVLQDWLHTESAQEAYDAIFEKDTSDPLRDLARNSGNVLLRVRADEDFDPEDVIYWIAAVNVIDLYDIWTGNATKVRLTEAYPWRGDVWNGGGMVSDSEPTEVVVWRADLRTDHGQTGYSWTEVASPIVSYYESKIEAVEEVNA